MIGIFSPSAPDADLADLIREAVRFHEDGADIVDLDTLRGGPFHGADEDTIALLVRGLGEVGIPVSASTTSADVASVAVDHGAAWIIDPSGATADPAMRAVAGRSEAGWIIGPWSPRRVDRYGAADAADAYTDGLVRNVAALLDAGVRTDRIGLHAGAGLSAEDEESWRMLNHLDRIASLGCRVLVDARDEILAAMTADDAERLEDAAVGLAVLGTGIGAWGIRVRSVGRVVGALQRMLEPRQIV